jgi:hypothetical protein
MRRAGVGIEMNGGITEVHNGRLWVAQPGGFRERTEQAFVEADTALVLAAHDWAVELGTASQPAQTLAGVIQPPDYGLRDGDTVELMPEGENVSC